MLSFRECTLIKLDKTFGLTQIDESPILQDWLDGKIEISDFERQSLMMYQKTLIRYVDNWNEAELTQNFIAPVFTLVNFSSKIFSLFAQRKFGGVVDGIEMGGKPDGIIAKGFREPEKTYFCFQEYKKEKDPEGDPAGQVLAAMLVAQEFNEHKHPIYGCYVKGRDWFFIVLERKKYCISLGHLATRNDIFDIFRILKVLKQIVIHLVKLEM
ncbi:MAG: hypothetical protein B6242_13595 [Anaerolineaceae bacterium 4572_78]|nr:MAG: hypothetical protein B6242_13595 [Anaerolineaceae bacterium 4572_78]